ncbi:hypothetical protein DF222_09430 [Corynebacterium yudongzhengii]|uniref:Aminotransferase n=1 Tax=Corynebacterium yudongzhengii TaxID=2080740 RepID=A0A2U1T528_9CORY|nr:hypothetical protein [Corynebacterium yudongzhengii]PWC01100.1 hypothetical protein DF222_09430 [Corynebacterium yudongzhengii]
MVAFMHTGTRLTAGYRYTTLTDATLVDVLGTAPSHGNFVWVPGSNGPELERHFAENGILIRSYPDAGARISVTDLDEAYRVAEVWRRR